MRWSWIALSFALLACTAGEQAKLEECEKGIGEACNQLGKSREGEAALKFYRRACSLANTNGCVNLADRVSASNPNEAKRALEYACERGNTSGCAKLAELLTSKR